MGGVAIPELKQYVKISPSTRTRARARVRTQRIVGGDAFSLNSSRAPPTIFHSSLSRPFVFKGTERRANLETDV